MMDYGEWLAAARGRLEADSFSIREDVDHEGWKYRMVAHRSRFEFSKFGNSENFFVFGEVEPATTDELRAFSSAAFDFATRNRKSSLPCGLFESVWCYAVAITEGLDDEAIHAIEEQAPTRHWAAAEIPAVYDTGSGGLYFFEKTPLWGAAYYSGFRNTILRILQG